MAIKYKNSTYFVKLTLDRTKVYSDDSNVPYVITNANISDDFWSNVYYSDCRDIVVTDQYGIRRQSEKVVADKVNKKLVVWTKLNPSTTIDTDIYLQCGDSTVNDSGSSSVWFSCYNDGLDYKAVYHLDYVNSGYIKNSTITAPLSGTLFNSPTIASGLIGSGLTFNGTNQYVSTADDTNLSFGNGTTDQPFTIRTWIKPNVAGNQKIVSKGIAGSAGEYEIGTNSAGNLRFVIRDDSGLTTRIARECSTVLSTGTWLNVVGTYNGSAAESGIFIYNNGVRFDDSSFSTGSYVAMENLGSGLAIGLNSTSYLNGMVDEIFILGGYLTENQIKNHYENESGAATNAVFTITEGEFGIDTIDGIERITSPIKNKAYWAFSAYSQYSSRAADRYVITEGGDLYGAIKANYWYIKLYKSSNNGYSWQDLGKSFNDTDTNHSPFNGSCYKLSHIDGGYELSYTKLISGTQYRLYISINGDTAFHFYDVGWTNPPLYGQYAETTNGYVKQYFYTYSTNGTYTGTCLLYNRNRPRGTTASFISSAVQLASGPQTGALVNAIQNDDICYVIYEGWDAINTSANFVTFDTTARTFGVSVPIASGTASGMYTIRDLTIARDGYNTLCAGFSDHVSASGVTLKYAISTDIGVTWDINTINLSGDFSPYINPTTLVAETSFSIIGGLNGGFLMAYIANDIDNQTQALVRELSYVSSGVYTLGSARPVSNFNSYRSPVSVDFFRPSEDILQDISKKESIRVGYQLGAGVGAATQAVKVDQDSLDTLAFPNVYLPSDQTANVTDVTLSGNYTVPVSGLTSFVLNEDLYNQGFTGGNTTKYMKAFYDKGLDLRLVRFDPVEASMFNTIETYNSGSEYNVKGFLDPGSITTAVTVKDSDKLSGYLDKDIRKVFLPANFYLGRYTIQNRGGYIKRTVWVLYFMDKRYEVTNMVPRIVDGEILYWECNAIVIGPNYNAFSRQVLPSET